jgi:Pin2-interacting protein X1
MGWTPDSDSETPKTGLMAFSGTKRLRAIPLPKTGMEGIGFRQNGPGAASATGALPSSTSGSMASAASNMFSKLGSKAALQFVSAGASNEVINRAKTEGGEFASLLSRLNASASATPAATDTEQDEEDRENQPVQASEKAERKEQKKKRKLEKEAKREAKRARREAGITAVKTEDAQPVVLEQEQIEVIQAALTEVAARPAIHNPRNAYVRLSIVYGHITKLTDSRRSRARNLASKRMLHANANALAEILGIAPTPPSGASTPVLASPYTAPLSLSSSVAPSKEASPLPSTIISVASSTLTADNVGEKKRSNAEKKATRKNSKFLPDEVPAVSATAAVTEKPSKKSKKRRRDDS